MSKIIKVVKIVFITLLVSAFGIAGHASALVLTTHDPVTHKATTNSCSAVCLNIPIDKNREHKLYDEDDDTPEPPYYLQFASAQTAWFPEKQRAFQTNDEPEKVPKYRSCCVIRR